MVLSGSDAVWIDEFECCAMVVPLISLPQISTMIAEVAWQPFAGLRNNVALGENYDLFSINYCI